MPPVVCLCTTGGALFVFEIVIVPVSLGSLTALAASLNSVSLQVLYQQTADLVGAILMHPVRGLLKHHQPTFCADVRAELSQSALGISTARSRPAVR